MKHKRKSRRYLEPDEIKATFKKIAYEKKFHEQSPFTGMATLCNYVLWKQYHYNQTKLAKYNEDFQLYSDDLQNGFYTYDDLQQRIFETDPEMKIESVDYTDADNEYLKKDKFLAIIRSNDIEQDNMINAESVKYLKIFFNIMIDYGFDQKKLRKMRDRLDDYLVQYMGGSPGCGKKIMDLWHQLEDEAGIHIQMPIVKER